jgi:hypothetical protein
MPTCPVCHRIDRLQLISALLNESTTGAYGPGVGPVVSSTRLATALRPPDPPEYESPWGCGSVGCAALAGLYIVASFVGLINEGVTGQSPVVIAIVFGIPSVALVILVRNRADAASGKRAELDNRRLRWNKAMAVWASCYYCSRDGCVSSEKTEGRFAPSPDGLAQLIGYP